VALSCTRDHLCTCPPYFASVHFSVCNQLTSLYCLRPYFFFRYICIGLLTAPLPLSLMSRAILSRPETTAPRVSRCSHCLFSTPPLSHPQFATGLLRMKLSDPYHGRSLFLSLRFATVASLLNPRHTRRLHFSLSQSSATAQSFFEVWRAYPSRPLLTSPLLDCALTLLLVTSART